MILFLLLLLLALAIGGAVALFVARDPGYVLVGYNGATLETSVWFALLCAIAFGLALFLISLACRRLLRVRAGVAARGERRARAQAQRGTMLLAEGRWREAIGALLQSANAGGTPLANYVGAARAANRLGSFDERDAILARATKALPDAALALELTRAELQQAAGQWPQAVQTYTTLRQRTTRHPAVLNGLLAAHRALDDAEAAAELAPELPTSEAVDEAHIAAWRARLQRSQASAEAAAHARNTWRAMPRKLRDVEALVLAYVDVLAAHGAEDEAEAALRRALKKHWRRSWVLRYGTISGDVAKRRANADGWLRRHADDAPLLLTLGRLALAANDLPAAHKHLLASLEAAPTTATLVEVARLYAAEGDHQAAISHLERALESKPTNGTEQRSA